MSRSNLCPISGVVRPEPFDKCDAERETEIEGEGGRKIDRGGMERERKREKGRER